MAALVAVFVLCVGGLAAIARRSAASTPPGKRPGWRHAGTTHRPPSPCMPSLHGSAVLRMRRDGDFVVATVRSTPHSVPGLTLGADAIAAIEPVG